MTRFLVLVFYAVVLALPGAVAAGDVRDTVLVLFDDGRLVAVDVADAHVQRLGHGWTPAWSPDGRSIAVSRDGDLFLLSANGSRSRRLTRDELLQFDPVWSPDGTRIAYLQQHADAGLGIPPRDDIVVIELASGVATQLTFDGHSKSELAWSPDGTRLIYEVGGKTLRTAVTVIDAKNGEAIQPELNAPYPIWSPGGRRLAYVAAMDERLSLVVADADGSRPRVLFRGAPDVGVSDVTWSPSGRFIAFAYGLWSVSHARLELVDAVTGRVRALTTPRGHIDTAPSWSPDSGQIVFARYEKERKRYAVAVVGPDGRHARVLLRTRHFGQPLWRPRGH